MGKNCLARNETTDGKYLLSAICLRGWIFSPRLFIYIDIRMETYISGVRGE